MGYRQSAEQVRRMDAYWRATLYLCAGMLYLRRNPLLREPLKPEHIKRRLLGHWGSDPGQTFKAPAHTSRSRSRTRSVDSQYAYETGEDRPEVQNWKWGPKS